jgi:spermidine synthase
MKPRIILAHTTLPDGGTLELHEHDERFYLHSHGQQLAGTAMRFAEDELAKLGTHPFRPARQPKVWIMGLGLGGLTQSVCAALPQKKGNFTVFEPIRELVTWQKTFFKDNNALLDSRVSVVHDLSPSSLARESGSVHAILLQADSCPLEKGKILFEDRRWLGAARDALQAGGMLGITSIRKIPGLYMRLRKAGFDVSEHLVEAQTNSKRPRRFPLLLARKPAGQHEES